MHHIHIDIATCIIFVITLHFYLTPYNIIKYYTLAYSIGPDVVIDGGDPSVSLLIGRSCHVEGPGHVLGIADGYSLTTECLSHTFSTKKSLDY